MFGTVQRRTPECLDGEPQPSAATPERLGRRWRQQPRAAVPPLLLRHAAAPRPERRLGGRPAGQRSRRSARSMPDASTCPTARATRSPIIDPRTYRVCAPSTVGHEPQHVVPSWDLKTLWVNNDLGNSLTPIDPAHRQARQAGHGRRPVQPLLHPGRQVRRRDGLCDRAAGLPRPAHHAARASACTCRLRGVNHADFSADGRFFLVSCEFSGELLKVDTAAMQGR